MSKVEVKKQGMLPRGTIVLVPFPFTDLSANKVRPALVISAKNTTAADVVVLFISSKVGPAGREDEICISENDPNLVASGLKVASTIKCRKFATLDRSIILGELGTLPVHILKQVDGVLRQILGV